jgi:hypothetical protein
VVSTKHKFEKLLWLPLTYKKVAVFFSGIGGFDMGLKKAQDLYGVAFKVVLAIDNSEEGKAKAEKVWRLENGVVWKRGDVDLKYVPLGLRREVIDLYHGSDFNMQVAALSSTGPKYN